MGFKEENEDIRSGFEVLKNEPAAVWTPMLREWNASQPAGLNRTTYLNGIHPLGYCPNGDAVADVCVFLLSDKVRFVTGFIMPVSGGAELGYGKI